VVRYREHRADLFIFFDRPDVPSTNDASEQDLHTAFIIARSSVGIACSSVPTFSAILTCLLTTACKRGKNLPTPGSLFTARRHFTPPACQPEHLDNVTFQIQPSEVRGLAGAC
jgi:hypothetical protein